MLTDYFYISSYIPFESLISWKPKCYLQSIWNRELFTSSMIHKNMIPASSYLFKKFLVAYTYLIIRQTERLAHRLTSFRHRLLMFS